MSPDVSPIDARTSPRRLTRQRLISEGEPPDQAERRVAQWEVQAAQDGIERDGRY
jgi:hypothetical protein